MLVDLFKACADETRMNILTLLLRAELSVADLVKILVTGQSRISHHLKILLDSGLIRFRKDGLWSYYSVNTEEETGLLQWLGPKLESRPDFAELQDRLDEEFQGKKNQTRQFFDSIADDWNALKEGLFDNRKLTEQIDSMIQKPGIIMDIGCGTGDLVRNLAKEGRDLIGVDSSVRMLKKASESVPSQGGKIQFRLGDAENLPARENEISLVILNMVLHHLPSPRNALLEASRVLVTEGMFFILDLLPHKDQEFAKKFGDLWSGLDLESLTDWLAAAGLDIEHKEIFPLGKDKEAVLITGRKTRSRR